MSENRFAVKSSDVIFKPVESDCSRRGCIHFLGMEPEVDGVVCKAFPEGIPMEIAFWGNDHMEPFAGDNGIRFEKEVVHDGQ